VREEAKVLVLVVVVLTVVDLVADICIGKWEWDTKREI
jgi:hypothetical protein